MSSGGHAGVGKGGAGGGGGEGERVLAGADEAPFADAAARPNPLIGRVDHLLELGVGYNPSGQGTTHAPDHDGNTLSHRDNFLCQLGRAAAASSARSAAMIAFKSRSR